MLSVNQFIKSVKAAGGAVKANPFVHVVGADGAVRKVVYSVDSPASLDSADVASAVAANGAKIKIASGAPKGALRGIAGSGELAAGESSALQFLEAYDACAVESEETEEAESETVKA